MTLDDIIAERAQTYGSFSDNAQTAQALKQMMRTTPGWGTLDYDQCEAMEMIASKISRILTGDPDHIDSWTDIAGYAKLVEDRLKAKAKK